MGHHVMDINSSSKPNTTRGRHEQDLRFDIKMKMISAV